MSCGTFLDPLGCSWRLHAFHVRSMDDLDCNMQRVLTTTAESVCHNRCLYSLLLIGVQRVRLFPFGIAQKTAYALFVLVC